jgi:ABC-type dipeptide/oligopeptide/nickel transport system ATPase subunit
VRLAIAVAAHLEPEILVVDEVLAVGDINFQKKCLGKMGEVSEKEGRTVLFVSHNMATIQNLCSEAMLLKQEELNPMAIQCIEKVKWLLENDDACQAIANAGQKRTLKDHTFAQRAIQLDKIIRGALSN